MSDHSTLALGGAVVYWTAAQRSDADRIIDALTDCDLSNLAPDERKPLSVLNDSIRDALANRKSVMIRPLSTRDGYDVVEEKKGEEMNEFSHLATVKYKDGVEVTNNGDSFQPSLTWDEEQTIKSAYEVNKALCTGQQVTSILLAIVQRLGGITLRPSGAVYWIPIDELPAWNRIARRIEQAAVRGETAIHTLTVTMDEHAQRAVIEGVTVEIEQAATELMAELTDTDKPLSKRQITSRKAKVEDMARKVAQYEHAIGESLTALNEKLQELNNARAFATIVETAAE